MDKEERVLQARKVFEGLYGFKADQVIIDDLATQEAKELEYMKRMDQAKKEDKSIIVIGLPHTMGKLQTLIESIKEQLRTLGLDDAEIERSLNQIELMDDTPKPIGFPVTTFEALVKEPSPENPTHPGRSFELTKNKREHWRR